MVIIFAVVTWGCWKSWWEWTNLITFDVVIRYVNVRMNESDNDK